MANEKDRNNKHIRILLEIVAMVAVCVAGFVIVRERTIVNSHNIEKNGRSIEKLAEMQKDNFEGSMIMRGDIREMRVEQRTIRESIGRIEKKILVP